MVPPLLADPPPPVGASPSVVIAAPPPRVFEVTAAPTIAVIDAPLPPSPAVGEPHQIVHASAADDRAMEEPTPLSVMLPPTTVHAPQHPVHVSVQQQLRPAASNPPTAGAAIGPHSNQLPLLHRRTLSFVPPTIQNGEIIVRPSLNSIRNGSQRWANTAVGYFLGRRPYFHHVKEYVQSVWPMVREVTATSSGFYFFQFKTNVAMEEVIEGGPWLFQGQPIILQKWTPGLVLRKLQHTQVPVWIKLRHLPVELWTDEGLSTVASGVGKPLYPDAITRACTRLDFARVCVMLDINSKLPRHLVIMVPHDDGSESPCKVDIEYEWLPPKCTTCMSLGHSTAGCPTVKPRQPRCMYMSQGHHRDTTEWSARSSTHNPLGRCLSLGNRARMG
ncbi:UNVERIFIED_CONTAM: hypothetical protein Sradi_7158700 [Sesamum radiatum]|uniref:DUF4283 domain-containing protein n=1 Tax=Sesamum radiatum TaxID=300843 RepID=A0AAW2IWA2_SESRA